MLEPLETKTEHKCDNCGDLEVEEAQSPDGRPLGRRSAYSFFVGECADNESNPLCRTTADRRVFAEFAKKCAHIWKKLPEEEKQRYHRLSEDDKHRYESEVRAFRENRHKRSKHSPRVKSSRPVSNEDETTSTAANDSTGIPEDNVLSGGTHCRSATEQTIPEESGDCMAQKAQEIPKSVEIPKASPEEELEEVEELYANRVLPEMDRKLSEPRNKMIKFMSVEEPETLDNTEDQLMDMAFDMWATEEMPNVRLQRPSIDHNDGEILTELLKRWDRSVPQEVKNHYLERVKSFDNSFNKSIRDDDEECFVGDKQFSNGDRGLDPEEEVTQEIDVCAEDCAQTHSKSSKV